MLKIRYLCGRNDNSDAREDDRVRVVICSKFAIFAVEMTTYSLEVKVQECCDLLKIRYLCGRNDNITINYILRIFVVICSKFAIFAVEMTTVTEKRVFKIEL